MAMGVRHARVGTALGEVTLVADGEVVTGLYFPGHWHMPDQSAFGVRVDGGQDALFLGAARELDEYLAGGRRTFETPVGTAGDTFSERVWALLRDIPYGETTTYGALAQRLGDRHLAQRVGQAVGRNPVCVFIPCHRVVGAGGALTGYAGGLDRKRRLLELEEPAEVA
ncbi:MAG TPA: methylated-DNA--[protein]-cysteine S-methyltransferase, partial [Streptomyces sp.]|nr:methylated-DNA--[protein]-cysteine S-methyltransferase [Streptomyces sp.]